MSKQIVFNCGLDCILVNVPTISEERQRAMDRANVAAEEVEKIENTYGPNSLKAKMARAAAKPVIDRAKALCPSE